MIEESNTIKELRTEDTRPMVPRATKDSLGLYDDLSNFIGQNEDYEILVKEGEQLLNDRYGNSSKKILVASRNKMFKKLFGT